MSCPWISKFVLLLLYIGGRSIYIVLSTTGCRDWWESWCNCFWMDGLHASLWGDMSFASFFWFKLYNCIVLSRDMSIDINFNFKFKYSVITCVNFGLTWYMHCSTIIRACWGVLLLPETDGWNLEVLSFHHMPRYNFAPSYPFSC